MRKFITFLILMIVALNINALGLSHIQVYSKLNEPLNSKINILSIPKGKSNVVRVNLASARAFRRAGLDRPFILTKIDFTVQKISKTSAVITVSSKQPIKEPFLNFLVEVSWPGGRILREYTVLLDPPLYKPISAKKLITRDTKLAIKPKYPPIQKRVKPKKRVTKKRVTKKRVTTKPVKGSSYTVFKNDTLSQIAQRTRPAGVSLNEQMQKIYRNNPKAFINGDKNRIKRGKVLKIPNWDGKLTKDELAQIAKNSKTNVEKTTKNTPKAPESSLVKESISNKRPQAVPKLVLSAPKPNKNDVKDTKKFKQLQNEIINLTEKNSSIESENKALKEEIAATKSLVINMKQQLDEMNNMLLAFKSEGFAKLQSQLAKQAKENKRLKEELANLKTAPKKIEDKKLTFKPTARLPSLGEHNDESIEDKPVNNKSEQIVASNEITTKPVDNNDVNKVVNISDDEQKIAENSEITTFGSELADSPKTIESGKTIRVKNIESDEPDFITIIDELVEENIPGGWITIIAIIVGIILLIIIARKRKPKSNEPGEWKITKLSDEEIILELSRLDEESKTSNLSEPNILEDIKQTTGGEDTDAQFEVDPKFDNDLREEVAQYTVAEKYSLAEDLIKSAIKKYPHHHKYRLELLEVYADAKEIDKFEKQAQLLYKEVDGKGPLWDETLELWKYLSPNKELSINNVTTEDNDGSKIVAVAGGVAVGAGVAAVALSGSDESDEIDDINTEINLGDELDLDSETGNDIDDGTTLDLGDDLDLDLDNDDGGDEIQNSDEKFDLNSENELSLDDDELSLDDLGDTDSSSEELSLDDDELSLDDLGDTDSSSEEL
ncbi:MAG TPA: LysM peptidoglycan-binding domain-containing protein, partial [Thioploca sp.]|nr:LysM peptidoglycan-binding domain-containing protein [Thioploca sp.]